jgi:hypothetical protein
MLNENFNKLPYKRYRKIAYVEAVQYPEDFLVETLEGIMRGYAGDYLCRGVDGEFWPVQKDIFERTYVELPEPEGPGNVIEFPIHIK